MGSQLNVVSNDVVPNECGLKCLWSQMKVVSNDKVSCECGRKQTGLKKRGLK